jgi:hypothetical protein
MTSPRISRVWGTILLTITIFSLSLPAYAQYSGGTGEFNDPYQIATAEDLMLLGETPYDYDKHFIMTADIDLDPNLPGRKVFDKAVIATADYSWDQGFTGVFNGNGHMISNLTITGEGYLGLFGRLVYPGEVKNLGVLDVSITGLGQYIGGLVGENYGGNITSSYSTGSVIGSSHYYASGLLEGGDVGGLVGYNRGSITRCHSTGYVKGDWSVGGLVGKNADEVNFCYSSGTVTGKYDVGGLVGHNNSYSDVGQGYIVHSYSTATVSGDAVVG